MAESLLKERNYIVIQSFMVKDLHLKGNELLVYAIIYGFTQTTEQWFTGSLQYLADWTNCTKRAIINILNSLLDKNLLIKNERIVHGVKFVDYCVNFFIGSEKFSLGGEISSPNNIEHKIERKENIINNIKEKKFEKPTLEQVKAYCEERQNCINPQTFIDFYESKGWKVGKTPMQDWKACVRTWENQRVLSDKTHKSNFTEREYSNGELKSIFANVPNIEDYDL